MFFFLLEAFSLRSVLYPRVFYYLLYKHSPQNFLKASILLISEHD